MSDESRPEVLSPDSVAPEVVASGSSTTAPSNAGEESGAIESPAKIIRIGAMVKQLLEEVRNTTLDEAAREQLRDIYENSLTELRSALPEELGGELDRLALDFDDDEIPSEAQLRIAKAQLVGWLEGLFHGIQATLMAQQMQARGQLESMRGQLPVGAQSHQDGPGTGGQGPTSNSTGYI